MLQLAYTHILGLLLLGTGTRLAHAGFVVHGMDYEGHGKSSGLQGYISSFDDIVIDCSKYFASVCGMFYKTNTSVVICFPFKPY
jgi:alpha-beta hydrolase superfamily lysophospholipase